MHAKPGAGLTPLVEIYRDGGSEARCWCSAKAYPLDALLQDCQKFLEVTGRRVTFEYTLLAGVNDSPAQASPACLASLKWYHRRDKGTGCSMLTAMHTAPMTAPQNFHAWHV